MCTTCQLCNIQKVGVYSEKGNTCIALPDLLIAHTPRLHQEQLCLHVNLTVLTLFHGSEALFAWEKNTTNCMVAILLCCFLVFAGRSHCMIRPAILRFWTSLCLVSLARLCLDITRGSIKRKSGLVGREKRNCTQRCGCSGNVTCPTHSQTPFCSTFRLPEIVSDEFCHL